MVLAVVIDGEGRPVCTEMLAGNTADSTVLLPVVDRLRSRFAIGRVCVVADRGMISAATIAAAPCRSAVSTWTRESSASASARTNPSAIARAASRASMTVSVSHTAKSGRDSALARARSTVKCCQNPGQIESEPAVK